jgi:hypothetical protein
VDDDRAAPAGVSVEVVQLAAEREAAYASFVQAHPDALSSYTLGYRDLLTELLGCQASYAVALRGERIVGVLPLMCATGKHGTVLNALPYFGSNGGPLVGDDDGGARDALCAWYAARAQAAGVAAATVIANPLAREPASVVHDLIDMRVGHVTPLRGAGDALARIRAAIDGSARRNVNKAQRGGTTVRVENDSFAELEALHRASMEAIGAQVKSSQFFAAIARHLRPGEDYGIYVARIGAQAAAALLLLYGGRSADYYVPAVSPDHRGEQPMAAILLQAMTDAAERGLAHWNWGGSWPSHETLQRFKAKWGGVRVEYRYETKVNDPDLLRIRAEDILAAYPGFYVVPFASLVGA